MQNGNNYNYVSKAMRSNRIVALLSLSTNRKLIGTFPTELQIDQDCIRIAGIEDDGKRAEEVENLTLEEITPYFYGSNGRPVRNEYSNLVG